MARNGIHVFCLCRQYLLQRLLILDLSVEQKEKSVAPNGAANASLELPTAALVVTGKRKFHPGVNTSYLL
jgi:hypothetical protein